MTTIRFGTGVIANAGLENANTLDFTDGNTELTGTNSHIQNRNLYSFIDEVAGGASGNAQQSAALSGAEFAQKLADMGYGGRTSDLVAENADDIVTITARGLVNNNEFGNLTGASGGVSFHGDADGFGVDNAPDSGGRWINSADALDFAVNTWNGTEQAVKTFTFTVNTNGGSARDVVVDFDGDVAVKTGTGQINGSMGTKTALDGFVLAGVQDGSAVTLNFDAKTVTVNGATSAMNAAMYAAFAEAGVDNVTVGARATDGLGFSISDVTIGAVDSFQALAGRDVLSLAWGTGNVNIQGTQYNNASLLRTTLDVGGNGTVDATVDLARQSNGLLFDTSSNSRTVLENVHLTATSFGVFDANIPGGFQHQTGTMSGTPSGAGEGLFVDTSAAAANPADGSSLGGNYGDVGPSDLEGGEFIRFELASRDAVAVAFRLNQIGDTNGTAENDVAVRLYQGTTLIETLSYDLDADGSFTAADNLFQAFDRVEIEAVAGSGISLRVADADFSLV